jgi:hypothetical protein
MLIMRILRCVPAWWIWSEVEVSGGEILASFEAFLFHILNVAFVQIFARVIYYGSESENRFRIQTKI